jgi:hypothetical protein
MAPRANPDQLDEVLRLRAHPVVRGGVRDGMRASADSDGVSQTQVRRRQAEHWQSSRAFDTRPFGADEGGGRGGGGRGGRGGATDAWWRRMTAWVARRKWLVAGAVGAAAVAVYSKPDAQSFKEYLRMRHAGAARTYLMDEAARWLGWHARSKLKDFGLFTVATLAQRRFVGVLGTWLELPTEKTLVRT